MPMHEFDEVAVLGDDNRRTHPGVPMDAQIVGIAQSKVPHMAGRDSEAIIQVSRQSRRQLRIDNELQATNRA